MARERYLIGMEEETIHQNEIVLTTRKQKWDHWWHYHLKMVIVIAIVVAMVVSLIYSIVTKVKPDYSIGITGDTYISEDVKSTIQDYFELYGKDLNGDGEVVVYLNNLILSAGDDSDSQTVEATVVKFIADVSEGESVIWLVDEFGYELFSTQVGGEEEAESVLADISDGEDPKIMMGADIKAFQDIEIQSEYESWTNDEFKALTFDKYNLIVRAKDSFQEKKLEKDEYLIDGSYELLENLISGTMTETE